MDEKDKMIQDLRRENEKLKAWVDELEDKDTALTIEEKISKIKDFIKWAGMNVSKDEMAIRGGTAFVLMILEDRCIDSVVSGDGEALIKMITMVGQDVVSKLQKEMSQDERPLS